jgi:hypothetical protein
MGTFFPLGGGSDLRLGRGPPQLPKISPAATKKKKRSPVSPKSFLLHPPHTPPPPRPCLLLIQPSSTRCYYFRGCHIFCGTHVRFAPSALCEASIQPIVSRLLFVYCVTSFQYGITGTLGTEVDTWGVQGYRMYLKARGWKLTSRLNTSRVCRFAGFSHALRGTFCILCTPLPQVPTTN